MTKKQTVEEDPSKEESSSSPEDNESEMEAEEEENSDKDHDDDRQQQQQQTLAAPSSSFTSLAATVGLDIRLRKAVARLGHRQPTPVQSSTWEQALVHGRDILMKAPTGSGKTIAYAIPLLQRILSSSGSTGTDSTIPPQRQQHQVEALVLVPTKELCHQVAAVVRDLSYYCDDRVTVGVVYTSTDPDGTQQAALRDRPNVLVATPSALVAVTSGGDDHAAAQRMTLQQTATVCIDEADLVLSFGYQQDVERIVQSLLPKIYQGFLVSATLSPDLKALQQIVLHNRPVVIHVEEAKTASGKLKQFFLPLPRHKDKSLLLYVFLKLGLLRGKGLFFVKSTNAGYQLKLILEQFFVRTAVLNAELPLRSRLNTIEQFNLGSFDYLIATDASTEQPVSARNRAQQQASTMCTDEEQPEKAEDGTNDEDELVDATDDANEKETPNDNEQPPRHRRSNNNNGEAQEYGVSRGVDFRNVSFVVNVDMPATPKDYAHRIGRTARGGAKGVALTLVVDPHEFDILEQIQDSQPRLELPKASSETLQASTDATPGTHNQQQQPQPVLLDFNVSEIEGFRYRVEDVSRGVTRKRVRDARAEELRAELLHAERLRLSAPEAQILAQPSTVVPLQDHLKHVPDYLLPRGMQVANLQRKRKKRKRNYAKKQNGRSGHRQNNKDPLQNFSGDVTLEGLEDHSQPEEEDESTLPPLPETATTAPGATGTGKSTSRRRAWKERHGKGEFSKKKRLVDRKHKQPLGI